MTRVIITLTYLYLYQHQPTHLPYFSHHRVPITHTTHTPHTHHTYSHTHTHTRTHPHTTWHIYRARLPPPPPPPPTLTDGGSGPQCILRGNVRKKCQESVKSREAALVCVG